MTLLWDRRNSSMSMKFSIYIHPNAAYMIRYESGPKLALSSIFRIGGSVPDLKLN